MENKKSIGLPGGPNEFLKGITQYISIEGYKRYSKDINNPVNIIESGSITMEDVDFPVMGTDNLGNSQMMMPGNNYQFPGDQVFEVPMAQTGYEVPKRNGVRLNYDDQGKVIGESSHIMKTETDGKGNWFSFPTLFQDEDGTWDTTYEKQIQLNEKNWMPAYKEAQRRGEVIDFGTDKEAAIKFGEGSWKPKMKRGGGLLDKTMECNNCGWSWKAADGGADVSTCHKCGGSALPKAQDGRETSEDSPISAFLNKTQDNVNDWLGDTMNPKDINKLFDLDLMGQMKILEDEYAKIWDSVNDELGQPENESAINNDPRVNDAWLRMNSFRDANPEVLQYEQAEDPLRHAIASANTSRAIQQKVRDTPYIGSLLDYIGADKAAGFVGSNLAGIGHEAMTILNDDRDWKDKGKESWEDIYNNFQGSLIGAQDISQEEIANKAFELYNAKKLKEGIVYQQGGQPTAQDSLDLYNLSLYKYNQIKNGDVQYKGKTVSAGDIYPSGTFNAIKGDDYAEFADDNLYSFQNKIAPTGEYVAGIKNDPKKLFGITYDTGGLSGSLNYVYPKPKGEVNLEDYKNSFLKIKEFEDSKKNKDSKAASMIKAQLGNGEYKVSSGDTFYGIANKNNVTWDELKKANPNIGYNDLKLNQSIVIPKKIDKPANVIKRETVKESVQDFQITPQLLYKQAYIESNLNPKAKNSLGYMGLGQIGKSLINDYKKANKVDTVDPFDPKQNYDVQAWSMNELFNSSFIDKPGSTMENKLLKSLASYNWGRGNVLNLLKAQKAKGADIYKSTEWMQHLPKETREYIQMIVYDGKPEKRPLVQENFLKTTTDEKYKDLRALYNYKQGGEPNLFDMYSGYINGDYDGTEFESKAALTYDKLNRVYYKEAKDAGMNIPNYIMTYVIGNS